MISPWAPPCIAIDRKEVEKSVGFKGEMRRLRFGKVADEVNVRYRQERWRAQSARRIGIREGAREDKRI